MDEELEETASDEPEESLRQVAATLPTVFASDYYRGSDDDFSLTARPSIWTADGRRHPALTINR